jgi:hypothetical protein
VGDDVPVDSEALLVTDFMNLKIKSAQSFGCGRGRVCVRMFIGVSACTCMSICVCTVFLKEKKRKVIELRCAETEQAVQRKHLDGVTFILV